MAKSSSIVLFLLVLLFVGGLQLCFCKNSTFGCIKREREALLQLKQSFNDPFNRLVSWTGNDCCLWNGVSCNQITGRVVKLDLRAPADSSINEYEWEYFSYVDPYKKLFATKVDSCLVELKRLEYLDLSGNDFNQSPIPEFFGSLKHLKYLNLSRAGFGGRIPAQLGNLTSLQILHLSGQYSRALYADNFQWVLGLWSLKHLEMRNVNLSNALDVMQVLDTLPSLIDLGLNGCGIQNVHFPHGSPNSTFLKSVQFLSLKSDGLTGPIPNAIQNMTALRELDLSYQKNYYYNGGLYVDNFQWFSRLSSLEHFDMSGANLTKALDVMQVLNKLPSLIYLGLNDCGIRNIHFPRGSLNSTFLRSVQFLRLSENGLTGPIPNALQNMTSLRELDLSYQWSYVGGLYVDSLQWFLRLSSLQHLDMSGADLSKALDVMQVLNKLPSLVYLGLQFCGIQNIHFPRGSLNSTFLRSIQFLNLYGNGLTGPIPNALQNMTALRELDLSYQHGGLYFDTVQWGSRLSSLQHLDMSGTNLSKAIDLMWVFNTLPALLELRLYGCGIQNIHFPHGLMNSTFFARIQFLDLRNNELRGPIPDALHNMTAVRVLELSNNYFNSTIPLSLVNSKSLVDINLAWNEFENIEGGMLSILNKACSLRSLDLSGNSFLSDVLESNKNSSRCLMYHLEYLSLTSGGISGDLPDYLGQLKGLKELYLAGNSFFGPIPSSLGELSELRSLSLENNQLTGTIPQSLGRLLNLIYLDLSNNTLKGIIPQSLGRLSNLYSLDLSSNHLNGTIPKSLGRLSNLNRLDLSHNQLNGSIPDSLWQLGNLHTLRVSSNSLQGIVSELNFANLSRLRSLDIGSSNLSFIVKSDWIPPFSDLYYVNMSSCEIGSQFPRWIQTQKSVEILDFSNTSISGELPMNIADKMPRLRTLRLPNNLMNGQLPDSLCKLDFLEDMDLSGNRLSGEMPRCWRASQRLYLINLSSNKLSGTIPNSVGHLSFLKRLHIDKNNLTGVLPLALRNCKELEILDLGQNKFSGSIPTWIGESLSSLRVLRLRNNMLSGRIPPQLCQLGELQILSLAYNNLRGRIPHCFGNLIGMIMEKFPSPISKQAVTPSTSDPPVNPPTSEPPANPPTSEPPANPPTSEKPKDDDTSWSREKIQEVTKGIDLEYTKMQLKLLDLMDLSSNKLDGVIPEDLCRLNGLRSLNLSHNQFSGNIPNRIGELKLLESLDLSDNDLSGSIPSSMSALPSISHLNLSHNKLSGKIPTSNQLQTLDDPSIYAANLQLCGYPLPKCHDDSVQPPTSTAHKDEDHEEDKKEKILFYFVVSVGYATGLWGVIGTLVFKRNWRLAYFRFFDSTKDRIIVAVAVEVARLKQRMQRTNTEE